MNPYQLSPERLARPSTFRELVVQQSGVTQADDSDDGLAEAIIFYWTLILLKVGFVTYRNHLATGSDVWDAVAYGIDATRKWFGWILFITPLLCIPAYAGAITWDAKNPDKSLGNLLSTTVSHMVTHDGLIIVVMWVVCLGPLYVRNVDYCLFKRRLMYWINLPSAKLLAWVPTIVLYTVAPWAILEAFGYLW